MPRSLWTACGSPKVSCPLVTAAGSSSILNGTQTIGLSSGGALLLAAAACIRRARKERPFLAAVLALPVAWRGDCDQHLRALQRVDQAGVPVFAELEVALVEEAHLGASRQAAQRAHFFGQVVEEPFQVRVVVAPGVAEEEVIAMPQGSASRRRAKSIAADRSSDAPKAAPRRGRAAARPRRAAVGAGARADLGGEASASATSNARMRSRKPASSSRSFRLRLSSANHGSAAWSSITAGLPLARCRAADQSRSSACTATLSAWQCASSSRSATSARQVGEAALEEELRQHAPVVGVVPDHLHRQHLGVAEHRVLVGVERQRALVERVVDLVVELRVRTRSAGRRGRARPAR